MSVEIAWSPSGNALLLLATDTITVVDSQGATITELGPTISPGGPRAVGRYPLWSPEGLRIAYWAADSAELRTLSLDSMSEETVAGDYRPFAWLSRSESILVTSNHQASADGFGFNSWEVSLLDLTTGSLTRVPFLDAGSPLDRQDGLLLNNQQYWLSPNDEIVIHPSGTPNGDLGGLAVYDVYTGSFTPIPDSVISYPSEGIPPTAVTFSEDGAQIYWLDYQQPMAIYRANIDGTGLQRLADLDSFGAALSPDLTAIGYTGFSGQNPGFPSPGDSFKLYVAGTDGATAVEIDLRKDSTGYAGVPSGITWRPRP